MVSQPLGQQVIIGTFEYQWIEKKSLITVKQLGNTVILISSGVKLWSRRTIFELLISTRNSFHIYTSLISNQINYN